MTLSPVGPTRQMPSPLSDQRKNAIHSPSGDQTGENPSWETTMEAPGPVTDLTFIEPRKGFSTCLTDWYAMLFPSGEMSAQYSAATSFAISDCFESWVSTIQMSDDSLTVPYNIFWPS